MFGHGNAFKVVIPNKKGEEVEEVPSSYGEIMEDRLNSDTPEARNIKKFLEELKNRQGEEMAKNFAGVFAKALNEIDEANEYTTYRFKKFPLPANDVYWALEVIIDVMDYELDEPELAVRCRRKSDDEVVLFWSYEKFLDRLELMADWYSDMTDDGILNEQRFIDPWLDVTEFDIENQQEDRCKELEDQIEKLTAKVKELKDGKSALDKRA